MAAATIWAFDSRNLGFSILRPDGMIYNFTKSTSGQISIHAWDPPPAVLTVDYVRPLPQFSKTCTVLINTYCLQLDDTFVGMDGYGLPIYALDANYLPIEQTDLYTIYTDGPVSGPVRSGTGAVTPR